MTAVIDLLENDVILPRARPRWLKHGPRGAPNENSAGACTPPVRHRPRGRARRYELSKCIPMLVASSATRQSFGDIVSAHSRMSEPCFMRRPSETLLSVRQSPTADRVPSPCARGALLGALRTSASHFHVAVVAACSKRLVDLMPLCAAVHARRAAENTKLYAASVADADLAAVPDGARFSCRRSSLLLTW